MKVQVLFISLCKALSAPRSDRVPDQSANLSTNIFPRPRVAQWRSVPLWRDFEFYGDRRDFGAGSDFFIVLKPGDTCKSKNDFQFNIEVVN